MPESPRFATPIVRRPYCGNGTLNLTAGEVCDDGDTVQGDGCSDDCKDECGDGICNPDGINGYREDPCSCKADCDEGVETLCDDGLDDDCDGCTDCSDADRMNVPRSVCKAPFLVAKKTAQYPDDYCTPQSSPCCSSTDGTCCVGDMRESFGERVAIDGDRAVVTAPNHSGCRDENGDRVACRLLDVGNMIQIGSADVFEFNGCAWEFKYRIELPFDDWKNDNTLGRTFVAISGNRVVTARSDNILYFFEGGTLVTKIEAPFGQSIRVESGSISGNLAVTGSTIWEGSPGRAVAHRYKEELEEPWEKEDVLLPETFGFMKESFGFSVSVASWDGVDLVAVGGSRGRVTVFRRVEPMWHMEQSWAPAPLREYGLPVAISIHTDTNTARLVFGAPGESCAEGERCGAAYVFRFDGTEWTQEARLSAAPAALPGMDFGHSVSISDNRIVVGVASGIGFAFVLGLNDNGTPEDPADDFWYRIAKFEAPPGDLGDTTGAQDKFGRDVAISGDRVLVGAQQVGDHCCNRCGATAAAAGAAYFFNVRGDDCNDNDIPDLCEVAWSSGCSEGTCLPDGGLPRGCLVDSNQNCIPDTCEGTEE